MQQIELWTDGSCKRNGQEGAYGGWAAIISDKNTDYQFRACGREELTTNNIMEMKAIINGLRKIGELYEKDISVIVYSDSAYVLNCYTQRWYDNWIKNGWKNSKKERVKNKELWEELVPYFENPLYDFRKVAGHSGVKYNEIVDEIAQCAAESNSCYGLDVSEGTKIYWKMFKEMI